MILRTHKTAPGANFSYLVADEVSREGAVVDPPPNIEPILALARAQGVTVRYVLTTHGHADHTGGNRAMVEATGARVAAHTSSRVRPDIALDDGSTLMLGGLRIDVLHTPGHTPDSVCYLADGCLFSGDTLFVGECGRADLPGSDPNALYDSLFVTLGRLPGATRVYPGHDYGPKPSSTLEDERRTNYTLAPRSREQFVRFLAEP